MLPKANPAVIYRSVDDGAVLFSTDDEVYFGLNDVGAHVWEALAESDDWDELVTSLERRYPGVSREVLRDDAAALVERMVASRLLLVPSPPVT